ncbi:MAG: HAMP domain-containing histidine kinase [Aquabacterium sp.]|nr:HAMP domain-containing histidine kinase [Aquabacterium sp.]
MSGSPITLVAHDLKNALGSLESQLAALVDEPSAASAQAAHRHCMDLRQQFIQFLTLYGNDGVLRPYCEDESPLDTLASLARQGEARHLSQPGSPAIAIDAMACEPPPYWYYDTRLVQMALDAALHNASRFARSQITLSASLQQGFLVFQIDDDGPGLDAPDTSHASTGLGTQLCQAVAQVHRSGERQGHIELINRPEGGTRFELWLP